MVSSPNCSEHASAIDPNIEQTVQVGTARQSLGTSSPGACNATSNTERSQKGSNSLSAQFTGPELASYRKLFNGSRAGDIETVRELLSQGILVNCIGPRGATPLHIAARFGQLQMVELLIAHGANPNSRDDREQTPANKAQAVGQHEIVQRLA
eukprot:CAMPEP_0119327188 /NCGR_PEP_ID=MMETSP1333-20130426/70119_1 /TAXON_ID=418940 /ORGANISM="Scyphosphaera apsteinii, Strain RCC1455" /LENGTH=152 /DNA_ID=CAMNT_0007335695 /DNA_START=116 /DNA_END=570 /DNA_ORIENTATION=+